MKIKRSLVLAVVFSVLLNLALVSVVSGTGGEPPPELGTIIVHKFNDANGNGVQDEGEMGIEGWLIRLYVFSPDPFTLYAEGRTGPDGTVTFEYAPANFVFYKVMEEARLCWAPTFPDGLRLNENLGGYGVLTRLDPGMTRSITFGNTYTCAEFDGCTPGGWQGGNLSWRWDQAGDPDWDPPGGNPFDHATLFDAFFDPVGSLAGPTMIDLVGTGGKKDHARKAARSLVAAYLNASHAAVNYPATEDELVSMWAAAVTSGEFLELHKTLDTWNNLGCSVE